MLVRKVVITLSLSCAWCIGSSGIISAQQVVGAEVHVKTEECIEHNGSHLLRQDLVSKNAVPSGNGVAWSPWYLINLYPPAGYRPYAASLIVRSDGVCKVEDSLDGNQNVIAHWPQNKLAGGTEPGENCGIREENEKDFSLEWQLQGHHLKRPGPYGIPVTSDYPQKPSTEEVTVYWEPINKKKACLAGKAQ